MSLHGQLIEGLPYVEGVLNYAGQADDKPRKYASPRSARSAATAHEPHTVRIRDMRPVAEFASLDREGFVLLNHRSAVADFSDDTEIRRVYYREAERLVAQVTGGTRVVVFDHTVRRRIEGVADREPGAPRQPSTQIHGDYSVNSGPQRVRDIMGGEAETLLKNRFAIVNVWRPIRGPLRDAPLALCDASSVAAEDWIAADLVYGDRTGEYYLMRYRPSHHWYYVPAMRSDEVLLLKCFDSVEDGRSRFVPHTAFIDPTVSTDIPSRESIELRAFVFYES